MELIDGINKNGAFKSGVAQYQREKFCVLFVDKQQSEQEIYKRGLEREVFSVISLNDSYVAVKILKARTSDIDIIVLNMREDVSEVYELLCRLKATPGIKEIPVIILFSMDSREAAEKAMTKGAARCLTMTNLLPSRLAEIALAEIINKRVQKAEKSKRKINCWQFFDCGLAPGGSKSAERGVCPVSIEGRLSGIHGGINAGRACWAMAGTMCGGKVQNTFAEKYQSCVKCDFYGKVREEEGKKYQDTIFLLNRLHE